MVRNDARMSYAGEIISELYTAAGRDNQVVYKPKEEENKQA